MFIFITIFLIAQAIYVHHVVITNKIYSKKQNHNYLLSYYSTVTGLANLLSLLCICKYIKMNLYQLYWNILGIENILKQADTFPPKSNTTFFLIPRAHWTHSLLLSLSIAAGLDMN